MSHGEASATDWLRRALHRIAFEGCDSSPGWPVTADTARMRELAQRDGAGRAAESSGALLVPKSSDPG